MHFVANEKKLQEQYPWERALFFNEYSSILGYYQALSCIENATGSTALDLACGDGTITSYFAEHFTKVVGVDASNEHLQKAREKIKNAVFHESLIEDFEPQEQFDSVFMLNLLEHVIDPIELLKKAASFLKPNGKLIVHVPNAEAINRKIAVKMGTLLSLEELSPFDLNILGHRRSYTLDTFTKDIEKANLNIVKTGGVFYKMLSSPQMDWFLKNGPWEDGGFGWGRVGNEKDKDWKAEFCRACYELGNQHPRDCNVIYAVITL